MTTTTNPTKPEMILWLSAATGEYIPHDFAVSFADRANSVIGVSDDEWKVLEAGPDTEDNDYDSEYWKVWADVLCNAVVSPIGPGTYTLHHDGDLWLVPVGMEWDNTLDNFAWPHKTSQPKESTR